jgi:hypothetical protein
MRSFVFVPIGVVASVMFAVVACRSDVDCSDGDTSCHPVSKAECDQGKVDCGGTCASLSSDTKHCGACGNQCAPSSACIDGACLSPASACTPLQTSCVAAREDGQLVPACVDIKTDANNCGSCGNACAADAGCIEGRCTPLPEDGGSH